MLLRVILAALAGILFYQLVRGFSSGRIFMRGYTADREEKPLMFYLLSLIYLIFGVMLLYFAFFGKIQK